VKQGLFYSQQEVLLAFGYIDDVPQARMASATGNLVLAPKVM